MDPSSREYKDFKSASDSAQADFSEFIMWSNMRTLHADQLSLQIPRSAS
jgi:hypothetical protein